MLNTHIHYDHVGWNTRLEDGAWLPTFPNARYLVPRADYDYFHPDNADQLPAARSEDERVRLQGIRRVFADSILPVNHAGQLVTWADFYDLGAPRLRPAGGHTVRFLGRVARRRPGSGVCR